MSRNQLTSSLIDSSQELSGRHKKTIVRSCSINDIETAAGIIASTFKSNHGVCWLLKHGGKKPQELKKLAEYAFVKALRSQGAYIADSKDGIALCYQNSKSRFSFTELYYQLRFVLTSIRLSHLPKILKRESYRKKVRSQFKDYIYFWFLGVIPKEQNVGFELKNKVIEKARKLNLPICLETSSIRHKLIYERLGFETYHFWENKKEDIRFWFMYMKVGYLQTK